MKNIILLFCFALMACQQQTPQIFGTWYHLGLNQTENIYYSETEWNTKKSEFLNLGNKPNPAIQNQRTDLYEKLILKNDGTFISQLTDLKTNKPFEKSLNGSWKLENKNLALTVKIKDAELHRVYQVQSNSENKLELKIIKEIATENGKQISDYDFSIKEKVFKGLVNQIGIDKNEFLAEPEEYADDFWEIQNFGKYQILARWRKGDDISKFSEPIKDVINGQCFNYMPYYDPIFECTSERLIFNKNNVLTIRYRNLGSRSEGCGTLSNSDYKVGWEWNKRENTIEVKFNNKEKIPFEILSLFRSKELKTEKFKILAKNDKVMIWEKVE